MENVKRSTFQGPLRVHPTNPRYFTDHSGRAIYLAGSHTWFNFQDGGPVDPPPTFDYKAYLDWMGRYGHNFIRLWAWEQARWAPWEGEFFAAPHAYERTGPELALDGKPKFDLEKFNENYFNRL